MANESVKEQLERLQKFALNDGIKWHHDTTRLYLYLDRFTVNNLVLCSKLHKGSLSLEAALAINQRAAGMKKELPEEVAKYVVYADKAPKKAGEAKKEAPEAGEPEKPPTTVRDLKEGEGDG